MTARTIDLTTAIPYLEIQIARTHGLLSQMLDVGLETPANRARAAQSLELLGNALRGMGDALALICEEDQEAGS